MLCGSSWGNCCQYSFTVKVPTISSSCIVILSRHTCYSWLLDSLSCENVPPFTLLPCWRSSRDLHSFDALYIDECSCEYKLLQLCLWLLSKSREMLAILQSDQLTRHADWLQCVVPNLSSMPSWLCLCSCCRVSLLFLHRVQDLHWYVTDASLNSVIRITYSTCLREDYSVGSLEDSGIDDILPYMFAPFENLQDCLKGVAHDPQDGTPFRLMPGMSYAQKYCLEPYSQAMRTCMFGIGRK